MSKPVLVVVDVSNLYHCVKKKFPNYRIDYSRFLETMVPNGHYVALAFGSNGNENQAASFKYALQQIGFELFFKSPKIFSDGTRKADWDVGITVEILRRISDFDTLVLGSADGDMAPCLSFLKQKGKKIHILASGISHELRQIADTCTEMSVEHLLRLPSFIGEPCIPL